MKGSEALPAPPRGPLMFPEAEHETPSVTSVAGETPCFLIFCQPGLLPCLRFPRTWGWGVGGGDLTHYTEEKLRLGGAKSFSNLTGP